MKRCIKGSKNSLYNTIDVCLYQQLKTHRGFCFSIFPEGLLVHKGIHSCMEVEDLLLTKSEQGFIMDSFTGSVTSALLEHTTPFSALRRKGKKKKLIKTDSKKDGGVVVCMLIKLAKELTVQELLDGLVVESYDLDDAEKLFRAYVNHGRDATASCVDGKLPDDKNVGKGK